MQSMKPRFCVMQCHSLEAAWAGKVGRVLQHGRFKGVVGRTGEVLGGGAVREALGASGGKGEDH